MIRPSLFCRAVVALSITALVMTRGTPTSASSDVVETNDPLIRDARAERRVQIPLVRAVPPSPFVDIPYIGALTASPTRPLSTGSALFLVVRRSGRDRAVESQLGLLETGAVFWTGPAGTQEAISVGTGSVLVTPAVLDSTSQAQFGFVRIPVQAHDQIVIGGSVVRQDPKAVLWSAGDDLTPVRHTVSVNAHSGRSIPSSQDIARYSKELSLGKYSVSSFDGYRWTNRAKFVKCRKVLCRAVWADRRAYFTDL